MKYLLFTRLFLSCFFSFSVMFTFGQNLDKEKALAKAIKQCNYKEATRLIKEEGAATYYTEFVGGSNSPRESFYPKIKNKTKAGRFVTKLVLTPFVIAKKILRKNKRSSTSYSKPVGYTMLDYALIHSQGFTPEMLQFVKLLLEDGAEFSKTHAHTTKSKAFWDVRSELPTLLMNYHQIDSNEVFEINEKTYTPLSRLMDAYVGASDADKEKLRIQARKWMKIGVNPLQNTKSYNFDSALSLAVLAKNTQMIQLFLEQLTPQQIKASTCNALLAACIIGDMDIVKLLSRKGFDWKISQKEKPDGKPKEQIYYNTVLHVLVAFKASPKMREFRLEALQYFMGKGLDINTKIQVNYDSVTPLGRAITSGNYHRKTLRFLLDNGAEVEEAIQLAEAKRKNAGYGEDKPSWRLIKLMKKYKKK